MADRPLAAVVLAAGKGTRMRSELPKVLHPLLGLPMLAHPLQRMLELQASPVIAVVGYGGDQVRAAFAHLADQVRFVTQEEQLGTGHATLQARAALEGFDGDVLILPGDCPLIRTSTLRAFLAEHRSSRATLTLLTTKLVDPAHYGRVVRAQDQSLLRIVEAKDADPATRAIQEINSGIYLVDARFLFSALARVRNENAQREYYLTDIVGIAREDGLPLRACLHLDAEELAGVNDRIELAQAESRLRLEVNRLHMASGVTIEDPMTTRVELEVQIGPDTVIAPGVELRGACRIGRNCHIGRNAILHAATLEPHTAVGPLSALLSVEIGVHAVIGKHAALNDSTVGAHAYIGASSVIDRSSIGAHAHVGSHVAMTGVTLGDHVHVGSHAALEEVAIPPEQHVKGKTLLRRPFSRSQR